MRVMVFGKAAQSSETAPPTAEALAATDRFAEEFVEAGIFVAAAGPKNSARARRRVVRRHLSMPLRQLALPWAFVAGTVVALAALAVERLGWFTDAVEGLGWFTDDRITLWPTYPIFRLAIFDGSSPGLVLFILIVERLIWVMTLAGCALLARWLMRKLRRRGAA